MITGTIPNLICCIVKKHLCISICNASTNYQAHVQMYNYLLTLFDYLYCSLFVSNVPMSTHVLKNT
jgi:hypothetical protein